MAIGAICGTAVNGNWALRFEEEFASAANAEAAIGRFGSFGDSYGVSSRLLAGAVMVAELGLKRPPSRVRGHSRLGGGRRVFYRCGHVDTVDNGEGLFASRGGR